MIGVYGKTIPLPLSNTDAGHVDFRTITYDSEHQLFTESSTFACGTAIGFVVFDCLCLFLGAVALRSAVTAEVAEEMGEAVKPVANQLTKYIKTMKSAESSKTEVAGAVFGVVSTIYSGSCLGAALSTFLGSLTWYNSVLYGATALGTIMAAVATDGAAEIGLLVIEIATAGWVISDSIKADEACA